MRSIAQLVSELDGQGLRLWVEDGQIRYRGAQDLLDTTGFAELRARKDEALAFLTEVRSDQVIPPFKAGPRPELIPLSMGQMLWYDIRKRFDTCKDNVHEGWRLDGPLDVPVLEEALRLLVERHEILRTTYHETGEGVAYQHVHDRLPPVLERVDISHMDGAEREAEVERLLTDVYWEMLDIAAGPILRCRLIALEEEAHVLVLAMSHIAADGISLQILRQELIYNYVTLKMGERPLIPPLDAHYADFALWENSWLSGDNFRRRAEYWKERLQGVAPLDLPTAKERGEWSTRENAPFALPSATAIDIRAFARSNGVTTPMLLLTGLHCLFSRWSGQEQVLTGLVYNGRPAGAAGMVGSFITVRPFFTDLSGAPTFAQAVRTVRQAYVETHDPRRPVDSETIRAFNLYRVSANIMKFSNVEADPDGQDQQTVAGLKISRMNAIQTTGERDFLFDVNPHIVDSPAGISGYVTYGADWIGADQVEWLIEGLSVFMDAGMRAPDTPIAALPDSAGDA